MPDQPIDSQSRRSWLSSVLKIYGPALVATIIAFVVAYQFVEPAPPRELVIAAGPDDGAYFKFAERYQELLDDQGISVEFLRTDGSVQNLELLEAEEADVAFVQSGVGDQAALPDLRALASIYFEPLWIFCRKGTGIERIADLKGKRVAVGLEKSGTHAVAVQLLELNDLSADNVELLKIDTDNAKQGLLDGDLDAAFFVVAPSSETFATLIESPDMYLMSVDRADAYRRLPGLHYLSSTVLPEGIVDFVDNIPDRDIRLLAPAATLVAHEDLHPALVGLLLINATEVHGKGQMFEETDEFPSPRFVDFELHSESSRFFKSGPPFLMRFLPFWAATLIDRLKVMILPFLTILIPLFKIVPPTYRWQIRHRVFRWYRELRGVESQLGGAISPKIAERLQNDLARIENEAAQVNVPLSYAQELYNLRLHIGMVKERLRESQVE